MAGRGLVETLFARCLQSRSDDYHSSFIRAKLAARPERLQHLTSRETGSDLGYHSAIFSSQGTILMSDLASKSIEEYYGDFYRQRSGHHVYPVEFVVRAFLGNYPRHKPDRTAYDGKHVLDLGFGDGRNMPLLHDLGMKVHGVEISREICQLTEARMRRYYDIDIVARVGRNCSIPFEDASFDFILACHACYYIDPATRFSDNVKEIARVLKHGGTFVFSAPMADTYIMRGAEDLGDDHMRIRNDPYGVRNGSILKKFDRKSDIEAALSPNFDDFAIGACQNDFWGIEEHVWIVACRRALGESLA
jgi:SAM-dependent methyltransferase